MALLPEQKGTGWARVGDKIEPSPDSNLLNGFGQISHSHPCPLSLRFYKMGDGVDKAISKPLPSLVFYGLETWSHQSQGNVLILGLVTTLHHESTLLALSTIPQVEVCGLGRVRRPSSSGVGRKCFSYPESSGMGASGSWGAGDIGVSTSSTSRKRASLGGGAWGTSSPQGCMLLLLEGSGIFSEIQWGRNF